MIHLIDDKLEDVVYLIETDKLKEKVF